MTDFVKMRTVATAHNINVEKLLATFGLGKEDMVLSLVLSIKSDRIVELEVVRHVTPEQLNAAIDELQSNQPQIEKPFAVSGEFP